MSFNWTETDIKRQTERVIEVGWIKHFQRAGRAIGVDQALLLAIASRESNIMQIVGDSGNGYGIMQLDINAHNAFINGDLWRDPADNILEGAKDLAAKRFRIAANIGHLQTLVSSNGDRVTFEIPEILGNDFLRCTVAAYNCGLWSVYHFVRGRDPDYGTTGKNYSADVLARASMFSRLLL